MTPKRPRDEPCSIGCTFIGPVNGALRWGITDNSPPAGLFGALPGKPSGASRLDYHSRPDAPGPIHDLERHIKEHQKPAT